MATIISYLKFDNLNRYEDGHHYLLRPNIQRFFIFKYEFKYA